MAIKRNYVIKLIVSFAPSRYEINESEGSLEVGALIRAYEGCEKYSDEWH